MHIDPTVYTGRPSDQRIPQEEAIYDKLEELLNHILPKKRLREYGVQPEDLGPFARSVMENQQRLLKNSLIPVSAELIEGIYRSLY